jgi:hypothetical protein
LLTHTGDSARTKKIGSNNGFDLLLLKPKSGIGKDLMFSKIPANRAMRQDEIDDFVNDVLHQVHINECKQSPIRLGTLSDGIVQMTDAWIDSVIGRMKSSNDFTKSNLGNILEQSIGRNTNRSKLTKSVLAVHQTERIICVAKLN